jgi:iron complex outermembrane recepter protein
MDMNVRRRWMVLALAAAGVVLYRPDSSHGADAVAATDTTEGPQRGQLQEILVTARKVQEQLQQVPISITALSAEAIKQHDIVTLDQIRDLVPNLDVGVTAGSTTAANIYIRGVGTYDYQIYTDAPVTTYIDGVLNARPDATLFEVADLERVEVLRGPQGTLFGRNTTGGAISLITKGPSDQAGVEQRLDYGTYNDLDSRTIINTGELGDSGFKAKLMFTHHQRDGYVNNLDAGADGDPGSLNSNSLWFTLHGDLSSNLHLDYRADYTDHNAQEPFSQVIAAAPDVLTYFGKSPSYGGDPFNYNPYVRLSSAYAGDQPADHSLFGGHALTAQYDVNPALSFKDILGYRSTSVDEYINISGQGNLRGLVLDPVTDTASVQPVTPFNLPENTSRDHQISNELQALGTAGEFKYVGGLYFFYEKGNLWNPDLFTFVLPGGNVGINEETIRYVPALTTHSYAAYAQTSYRPAALGDKLELTIGGRLTHDEKEINEDSSFNGVPTDVRNQSHAWHNASGLFSASYQWTPDVMGYARVSNAYRAGGFVPNTYGFYDPEKDVSYEAGLKSDWLDKRLRVNASVFKTNYTDLQVQNTINGLPVITNAGHATYAGGELEITAVPTENLQLLANIGYVDPKYQTYILVSPSGVAENVANQAQFAGVSKINANVGAQYAIALMSAGNLSGRLDCSYRSRKVWFPLDSQNPYNEVIAARQHENLKARLILDDIPTGSRFKLRAEVYGANLLNEKVVAAGNDFGSLGFGTVVYEEMLTVGISLTADF